MKRIEPPRGPRCVHAAATLAAHAALAALAAAAPFAASAQEAGLAVSVGARTWYTDWTSFSYLTDAAGNIVGLSESSGAARWVLVPTASIRYGDFFASASAFRATTFDFGGGASGRRSELDFNIGYTMLPGLSVTLGRKQIHDRGDSGFRYEPRGPVVGMSGNAPLSGAFSIYGAVGIGRLKTPEDPSPNVVKFKSRYRLTEVGVAYTVLAQEGFVKRWTLTAGHRIQVMHSKEAFTDPATGKSQDGVDTTQGFTIGVLATF